LELVFRRFWKRSGLFCATLCINGSVWAGIWGFIQDESEKSGRFEEKSATSAYVSRGIPQRVPLKLVGQAFQFLRQWVRALHVAPKVQQAHWYSS
jgi:hypothetical protein